MKKTALLITALFGASLANAHNVWLEPVKDAKGQYVVKFANLDVVLFYGNFFHSKFGATSAL